ncbi:MAG: hypothetical protein KGI08_04610 [Thaumarchaeota archaeon]|nr:hypothetical protein [Nitrososphaerota archaeon]
MEFKEQVFKLFLVAVIYGLLVWALLTLFNAMDHKELQPCNSETPKVQALQYYDAMPDNPPLKVSKRWI